MFKTISVLVDNDSWILPYAEQLIVWLKGNHYHSELVRCQQELPVGDVCFLLGCTQKVSDQHLARNQYNLVVHESDLPLGKGFAPVAWQILAGQQTIPVCLISANSSLDSGDIWLKKDLILDDTDLSVDWRIKQGNITIELAKEFITDFKQLKPIKQQGESSNYPRRTPQDSQLDVNKSIAEQFDLLRVVDNKDYPAFIEYQGERYRIEIYRDE